MRALIISDTHCRTTCALSAFRHASAQKPVDKIIHLGDGIDDFKELLRGIGTNVESHYVVGNQDFCYDSPWHNVIQIGDKNFFITHGHKLYLERENLELRELFRAVRIKNLDGALFGHTHEPFNKIIDGKLYFNPGSAGNGFVVSTYGIIDVENNQISAKVFDESNNERPSL